MKVVTFVAAAVAFCFAAVPALAGLDFCNKADVRHSFAVAWKDGDDWRVEGWWNIDPGACKTVIGADSHPGDAGTVITMLPAASRLDLKPSDSARSRTCF